MRHQRKTSSYCGRIRGAVMIEAVLVVSVITIAFAGGIFFHDMLAAKFRANREARLETWTQALKGCKSKLDSGALFKTNGDVPVEEVDTGNPPGFFQIGHTPVTVSTMAVTAPALIGGAKVTFRERHQVACNDRLEGAHEDILGRIGDAMGTVIGSLL